MCVVCVYFVFYRTLLKPGAKRYRISPYAPHILRPEMFYTEKGKNTGCRTRHASAASGVISVKIRTSVHPPEYADQGHAPGHDAHSRCAPDSSESSAHNRAHQGQAPGHSTGKYTGSPR